MAVSDSLGTATMSPAWASVTRLGLLAAQQLQDVEALVGVGARVGEHGVGADRPRQHPQQRDLADVGVRDGLEHPGQRLAGRVARHLVRSTSPARTSTGGRVSGAGAISASSEARRSMPTPVTAEPHTTGNTRPWATPVGQGGLELLAGGDLAVEVALHEGVVADHDALDQLLAHLVLELAARSSGMGPGWRLAPLVDDGACR